MNRVEREMLQRLHVRRLVSDEIIRDFRAHGYDKLRDAEMRRLAMRDSIQRVLGYARALDLWL